VFVVGSAPLVGGAGAALGSAMTAIHL
jgi:hypothetical protein